MICLLSDWREILCCSVVHRSVPYHDTLLLANGYMFSPDHSSDENLKLLVERLIEDIVNVMKDLEIDRVEMSLLKLILLFDSGKVHCKR